FMAVGAYTAGALTLYAHLPPPVAMVCGGLAAAAAGVLVGLPSLRLSGDYLAVATLGFNGIIIVLIQNAEALGGAKGLIGLPTFT
ncbi:ABC transporter permease subunit, partial [Klebsiella aerogenes]|uniref:ABC transporter permease subunit n=1 Tax=Klebsiella aerogenes TaxID=548 RepID=UPI003F7E911E|nr:high-affinity branched-chain amino acid ABC transporter permease LivM [Klebsiella aerogenes]